QAGIDDGIATRLEPFGEQSDVRRSTDAVGTFDDDQSTWQVVAFDARLAIAIEAQGGHWAASRRRSERWWPSSPTTCSGSPTPIAGARIAPSRCGRTNSR